MTVSRTVIVYIRFDFFKIENKIQSKYIAQLAGNIPLEITWRNASVALPFKIIY